MSIVNVFVTTSENIQSERRLDKTWLISELKGKLEPITGISVATQKLELFQGEDLIGSIDNDATTLGSYPIEDYMRLHVTDTNRHRVKNEFTDTSLVQKFELSKDEYESRTDTVLAFKKRNKIGRFSDNAIQQQEQGIRENEEAVHEIHVGDRCEIQVHELKRRGTVRFIGETEFQTGTWVGVEYDEPLGKNDGSVNGKRYFTCLPKYGSFVKPTMVTVGDFPEEDIDLEEM